MTKRKLFKITFGTVQLKTQFSIEWKPTFRDVFPISIVLYFLRRISLPHSLSQQQVQPTGREESKNTFRKRLTETSIQKEHLSMALGNNKLNSPILWCCLYP